jgi:hypothetical protein
MNTMNTMNTAKYRRFYLGKNKFKWSIKSVELDYNEKSSTPFHETKYTYDMQKNHPLVLSGNAFWQTHNELCIGYVLVTNNDVFRPIFSHTRQRILDQLNFVFPRYINHFWEKYRTRSWDLLFKKKNLPIEIINIIINLAYPAKIEFK